MSFDYLVVIVIAIVVQVSRYIKFKKKNVFHLKIYLKHISQV